MKVYVLTYDWAVDGDSGSESVGVFNTRELAAEKMAKLVKEIKENHSIAHMDREEYIESDYYDLYESGYYPQEHEHLAITEHEIE